MNKPILLVAILLFYLVKAEASLLSLSQKSELLYAGTITDSVGNVYQISVIPGYKSIAFEAANDWIGGFGEQKIASMQIGGGLLAIPLSVKHLKLYFQPEPYRNMSQGWQDSKRSIKILATDFMGEGLADDWRFGLNSAEKYRLRGSSLWLVKYPWEIIKASVSSVLRITGGSVALGATAAYGVALRPSYELVSPWLKTSVQTITGAGYVGLGSSKMIWTLAAKQLGLGTTYPLAKAGYNTASGLLLGLTCDEPTIISVDGWWVEILPGSPDYFNKLDMEDSLAGSEISESSIADYAQNYHEYLMENSDKIRATNRIKQVLATIPAKIDSLETIYNSLLPDKSIPAESLEFMPSRAPLANEIPREQYKFVEEKIWSRLNKQEKFNLLSLEQKAQVFDRVIKDFDGWFIVDFQVKK